MRSSALVRLWWSLINQSTQCLCSRPAAPPSHRWENWGPSGPAHNPKLGNPSPASEPLASSEGSLHTWRPAAVEREREKDQKLPSLLNPTRSHFQWFSQWSELWRIPDLSNRKCPPCTFGAPRGLYVHPRLSPTSSLETRNTQSGLKTNSYPKPLVWLPLSAPTFSCGLLGSIWLAYLWGRINNSTVVKLQYVYCFTISTRFIFPLGIESVGHDGFLLKPHWSLPNT